MDNGSPQGFWANDGDDGSVLDDWNINFGQSPQCASYAKAVRQGQSSIPNCITNQTDEGLPTEYDLKDMPGLLRDFDPGNTMDTGTCCGDCSVDVPEVRLYYFPNNIAVDCYKNEISNSTSTPSNQQLDKRIHSLVANGSTAVVSGHTL